MRRALAVELWRSDMVRVRADEPFRLASGGLSPLYIDIRRLLGDGGLRGLVTAMGAFTIERSGLEADVLAGGETAGIPFAALLAASVAKPMVYVRKKPKGHGAAAQIEGGDASGKRVLLVEDLVTAGGSLLTFLDALERAGARVEDALAVFDRRQGGEQRLAERGVRLHSLCDLPLALAIGVERGFLDSAARGVVEAYLDDPEGWSAAR
ncbi:MAG: orotate phosphoribosyltransferase [Acidobacteriota bacterium]